MVHPVGTPSSYRETQPGNWSVPKGQNPPENWNQPGESPNLFGQSQLPAPIARDPLRHNPMGTQPKMAGNQGQMGARIRDPLLGPTSASLMPKWITGRSEPGNYPPFRSHQFRL